jgi:hypothetical protein
MPISPLENIVGDGDFQFLDNYYSGRASWNEQTKTLLFPSDGVEPVHFLKQDAIKVKQYHDYEAKRSPFKIPELPQSDPST